MPDFGIMRGFNDKLFGDKLYAGQLPTQLGKIGSENFGFFGLLDIYPNAAAAYSLRLLRVLYLGNAIRVRRSSDNAEQDIGFVSNGDLDTTALTTFCSGTNGFVTTWYDQSGNGKNATQSTAANQPQIVSSGSILNVNSKPSLKFDGITDSLLNSTFTNINVNQFFINQVLSHNGSTLNSASFTLSDGLSQPAGLSFLTVYPYRLSNYSLFYDGVSVSFGTNPIASGQLNLTLEQTLSTNRSGYINSTLRGANTANLSIADLNNLYIGTNDVGQNFDGNMQETILYLSDNSSNRTGIESNINTYYAIY